MISRRGYENDRNTSNEHAFLKEFYMDISYAVRIRLEASWIETDEQILLK